MEPRPTLSVESELIENNFAAYDSRGFTQALWNAAT